MTRPVGIPRGVRQVHAVPDTEPVEFDAPQCCYAAWLTPELMRATETTPAAIEPPATVEPVPSGQLAFDA